MTDRVTQLMDDGTKIEVAHDSDYEVLHIRITRSSGTGLAMYETLSLRIEEIEAVSSALKRAAARDHQGDDPS